MSNLNNYGAWIEDVKRQLARIKSGAFLENSSITNGRMRFIGGLLLIDSGGTLQVIGHLTGEGNFEWSGPWKFNSGDGEIAGNVKLTGDFDLIGKLINGDVRIEGNRIYIGEMVLDPTNHGGSVKFPNGAEVFTDGETIQLVNGNSVVQVADDYARLQNGGDIVEINGDGIRMSPGAVSPVSGMGLPAGVMIHGASGYVLKTDGS
jgi:hypothetical protein